LHLDDNLSTPSTWLCDVSCSFICVPKDNSKQCGRIYIICLWDAKNDQPFTANDNLWIHQRVLTDSVVVHLKKLYGGFRRTMYLLLLLPRRLSFSSALVCLLVSKVAQKQLSQFSQNSVERWHMGQGRTD